jgi:hypothetical protein
VTIRRLAVLVLIVAVGVADCGRRTGPTRVGMAISVDRLTRAVYADDPLTVQSLFDDAVRDSVTPTSVSDLGQRMRSMGGYQGVSLIGERAPGRYDFEALFDGGSMLLHVRFDPDGTIAAYRALPKE